MADTILSYADVSDDEDITGQDDLTLDDFDDLPLKDTVCKKLCGEFVATPAKVLESRQSISHSREHMKVYLRIRPFTDGELDRGESQGTINVDTPTCLVMNAPKDSFAFKSSQRGFGDMSHKFTFTRIFGEETCQKSLFDNTLLGVVKDFVDGQNCLVFTYGVTNAGKTHTIQGTPQDGGILPRALDVVFNSIEGKHFNSCRLKPKSFCEVHRLTDKQILREEELKKKILDLAEIDVPKQHDTTNDSLADSNTSKTSHYSTATDESVLETTQDIEGLPNVLEDIRSRIPDDTSVDIEAQGPIKFSIWVSFAEIYNEYIYDLLEPIPKGKKARRQPLKLSGDKNGSVFIRGMKEIQVESADEAYKILKIGQKNRSIASTKLNQCSSRSHCIFSIKILRVVDVDDPHVARVSQLSFCDLAGSERYTKTHNTGDRLKEAGNINTSLLTLGKCISTLRYNQNHPKSNPKMIPFRESKLTRLFQSFFLGKGKAHMIVNINQCASGFDETMHVLKFSAIAKQVTTVTSKLDNKWKAVPKKPNPALGNPRTFSMVINQSGTSRDARPSIAWATPGTAKAVAEELGELEELEKSILESEEDMEDDDDGEEGDTPMTVKHVKADGHTMTKLRQLVDVLKKELIEEKHKNYNMEAELREEICQEMAQQIVEIEEDYNERLKEEQEMAEEKFDRKLELYTKSVKKVNKRRRKDDDDQDDEYISSSLLAAEQVKRQERDAKIEDLECVIEKLKSDSEKDEEKMTSQHQALLELQSLMEANKAAVEEANKRLCDKDALLQQSQDEIQSLKESNGAYASRIQELDNKLDNVEALFADLSAVCDSLKQQLATKEQTIEESVAALKELQSNRSQTVEHEEEVKTANEELTRRVTVAESSLAQHIALLEDKDLQIKELKDAVEGAAKQESKFAQVMQELEKKVLEAESTRTKDAEIFEEKEAEITRLTKNLAHLEQSMKAAQKGDETATFEAHEQMVKVEHLEEMLRKAEKATSDLKQKLEASDEERSCERIQLQSHVAYVEEQLTSSKAEVEGLESKYEKMHEEGMAQLKSLASQLSASKEATAEALSDKNKDAEEKNGMKLETEQLRTDVNRLAEEKNGMKLEVEQQRTEMNLLKEKLTLNSQESERQIAELSGEFDKAKADLATIEQESTAKVAELNKETKNLRVELEKSQAIVNSDKSEMESLKTQIESLRGDLEKATAASAKTKKAMEKLKEKHQYHEEDAKDLADREEIRKHQVEALEADLEKEKTSNAELSTKIKELEDNLAGLQEAFDDTNKTGQHATARIKGLEDDLASARNELVVEQKAHQTTKEAASGYDAQISEMRMSLEVSERTAASMAKQIKRTKELDSELEQTKASLAEKVEVIEKLTSVTGDTDEMRSKLEKLDEKLQASEQQRKIAQQTLQETLSRCSSLEQSLEAKKDSVRDHQGKAERREEELEAKRSEVNKLQESQTEHLSEIKRLEESYARVEQDLASKTSTINMLMKKMEQKVHEVKTAQKEVKSTEVTLEALKSAVQEQEEAMTEQDKLLSSKEEDYKTLADELETLQGKYDSLMQTSAEDQKSLRKTQRDLSKANKDLEMAEKNQDATESAHKTEEELTKTVKTLQQALEETNSEVKDLEKELGEARGELSTSKDELEQGRSEFERSQMELEKTQEQCDKNQKELKERRREVTTLTEEIERMTKRKEEAEEMGRKQEIKDKKISDLEIKLEQQEKTKEQELAKWRKDRDDLVSALEKELRSLQEKERTATDALDEKDAYIEQLKKEMVERMSQSAAFTEDDDSEDTYDHLKTKRSSRRSTRTSSARSNNKRTSRAVTKLLEETQEEYTSTDASESAAPVRGRSRRGQQTSIPAIKEETAVKKEESVLEQTVPVQTENVQEEPIYEEPPSDYAANYRSGETTSSSDSNTRQPSMVILDQDETDTSRLEMEVTPLQKNTRKTRTTRRGKKRKSVEMLEDEAETTSTKKQTTKSTRGRRRTRAAVRDDTVEETENQPAGYSADAPLPQPGKRKAFSKIGDMLQNSPFGKSAGSSTKSVSSPSRSRTAKKLVDNMQSPKLSPPRTVEVQAASGGEGTKRRRKLYKTEISTPYECSPYESLSQQVEGTKHEEPPRTVEPPKKADNSHNIVTRKLRSRQKKTVY